MRRPRVVLGVLLVALGLPASSHALTLGHTGLVSAADGSNTAFDDPTSGSLIASPHVISADGTKVLISSPFDQGLNVAPRGEHLFVRTATGATLVDRASGTTAAASNSASGFIYAAISPDGNYVVFPSDATNLVPAVNDGKFHVYLRDLVHNTTQLVDNVATAPDVDPANAQVSGPLDVTVAASDGHVLVAFTSKATDLVSGAGGSHDEVYLSDMTDHTIEPVSDADASNVTFANGNANRPSLSGDGAYVVFIASATNLLAANNDGRQHVYRRKIRDAGHETIEIDTSGGANYATGDSVAATASDDGKTIAFETFATNLGDAGTDTADSDILVWKESGSPQFTYASADSSGVSPVADSYGPDISRDGSRVGFISLSDALGITLPNNYTAHGYVHDLAAGTNLIADRQAGVNGAVTALGSGLIGPSLDATGTHVAFSSSDPDLSTTDDDDQPSVFVRDTTTGTTTLFSGLAGGPTGYGDGDPGDAGDVESPHSVSADGRYVVFASNADGMAPGASSRSTQVFRRDVLTGATILISRANGADGAIAENGASGPTISADGSRVAFLANASNLGGDTGPGPDVEVYVRDIPSATTIPVTGKPGSGQDSDALGAVISGDGHWLAVVARGIVIDGTNNSKNHVYKVNLDTGAATLVDHSADGSLPGHSTLSATSDFAISDDGARVVFVSLAKSLLPGSPTGPETHVWLSDGSSLTAIDRATDGTLSDEGGAAVALSGDGRIAAFSSVSTNIGGDADSGASDIFIRDLAAGTTTWVAGNDGNAVADQPALDATGQHLVFASNAQLSAADANSLPDIWMLDRSTGQVALVSASDGDNPHAVGVDGAVHGIARGAVSANGACATFSTFARDVLPAAVPAGVPDADRVYLRAVGSDCPAPVGAPPAGPGGGGGAPNPPGDGGTQTPPNVVLDKIAPKLTGAELTNARFRVGAKPTAISATASNKAKAGTIVRFSLSESATVKLAIYAEKKTKATKGHKAKRKLVKKGTLTRKGRRGTNLVAFSGRIGKKKLAAGRYRLQIIATDLAGNHSKTVTVKFTIVSS